MQFKELPDVTYDFVGPIESKSSAVFPTSASYFIWKALMGPGKSCLYLAKSDRE